AGLGAGLKWVRGRGLDALRAHELLLSSALREGLENIPGVRLYGPDEPRLATAVVSFMLAGKSVSGIGFQLDDDFDILCRAGLHCAPAAHRSIGSFPQGTVRLAPGPLNTLAEIKKVVGAIERIAAG